MQYWNWLGQVFHSHVQRRTFCQCVFMCRLWSRLLAALADPTWSKVPLAEIVVRVAHVRTPRPAAAHPQGNDPKLTCQSSRLHRTVRPFPVRFQTIVVCVSRLDKCISMPYVMRQISFLTISEKLQYRVNLQRFTFFSCTNLHCSIFE